MPIQVRCTNAECAKSLRVNDELAGKTIRCPACKTAVKVSGAAVPATAPAAAKATTKPTSAPPPPPLAKKPAPAPIPAKTSPKPPPKDEVPTLDDFDDFDDAPPAKAKITNKPAPAKKSKNEEVDDFTDEAAKKGKAKKDDLDAPKKGKAKDDEVDDDYDEPKKGKKGKSKKRDDLDDLPDTLWEDCDLFRHERLATKCKFSIWKTKFTILNPDTDEEIGLAEENLPTWKGWLRLFSLGPVRFANWLTIDLEIREDPKGPVLFTMRKLATPMPWQLTSTIEILDFRKRRIGYFKTKLFSLAGGFWLYDDDGKQVAELKGKFSFTKPRMDFYDVDGEHLGDICMSIVDDQGKKKKGFKVIWGAIPMVMTMKEEIRDHIPTKILFLAATMARQLATASNSASIT
jgi:hypothetical protein